MTGSLYFHVAEAIRRARRDENATPDAVVDDAIRRAPKLANRRAELLELAAEGLRVGAGERRRSK